MGACIRYPKLIGAVAPFTPVLTRTLYLYLALVHCEKLQLKNPFTSLNGTQLGPAAGTVVGYELEVNKFKVHQVNT